MQTTVFDIKLIQIGRSLAIKLPPDYVKKFHLRKGQPVDLSIDHERGLFTLTPIRESRSAKP